MDLAKSIISHHGPLIDPDVLKYSAGYFDGTNELSIEAIADFLTPILIDAGASDKDVADACVELSMKVKPVQSGPTQKILGKKVLLEIHEETEHRKTGDIRHLNSTRGPAGTLVNQKKLENAEKKIAEKLRQRKLQQGVIVAEWDPTIKPQIIVNQMKQASVADSRSRDVKLENFDIAFAGKKILSNANLTLAFGRRYGLVGKNGIGKSTLLRAIANKELVVNSHLRVLIVEQEIRGDDTTALQSVLKADVERESLLKLEAQLVKASQVFMVTRKEAQKI